MNEDIRWKQRFDNYIKAFSELKGAAAIAQTRELTKLEKQGVIQVFEYTHELAWNVLKDFLSGQGIAGLIGSRDSTREAFKAGLITNGEVWMEMIKSRNLTSHTYDEAIASEVFSLILESFFPAFQTFTSVFTRLYDEDEK